MKKEVRFCNNVDMNNYPEVVAFTEISNSFRRIQSFLKWLRGRGILICDEETKGFLSKDDVNDLIFEYFEINPRKLREQQHQFFEDLAVRDEE